MQRVIMGIAISKGGACYSPEDLLLHASVAMNFYYQAEGRHFWNCNFEGSGIIAITDPNLDFRRGLSSSPVSSDSRRGLAGSLGLSHHQFPLKVECGSLRMLWSCFWFQADKIRCGFSVTGGREGDLRRLHLRRDHSSPEWTAASSSSLLQTEKSRETVGMRSKASNRAVPAFVHRWASREVNRAARHLLVVALLCSDWRIDGWVEGTKSSTSSSSHRTLENSRYSNGCFLIFAPLIPDGVFSLSTASFEFLECGPIGFEFLECGPIGKLGGSGDSSGRRQRYSVRGRRSCGRDLLVSYQDRLGFVATVGGEPVDGGAHLEMAVLLVGFLVRRGLTPER
ncbi:hypothetical protein Bca4012_065059 [Brassica carinata]